MPPPNESHLLRGTRSIARSPPANKWTTASAIAAAKTTPVPGSNSMRAPPTPEVLLTTVASGSHMARANVSKTEQPLDGVARRALTGPHPVQARRNPVWTHLRRHDVDRQRRSGHPRTASSGVTRADGMRELSAATSSGYSGGLRAMDMRPARIASTPPARNVGVQPATVTSQPATAPPSTPPPTFPM